MSATLPSTLTFAGKTPIARGDSKLVFTHPDDGALLVKVVNPAGNKAQRNKNIWYKGFRREKDFIVYRRELNEFLVSEAQGKSRASPIARIFGIVSTDLGLGLVVENIRGRDGRPGRTLESIVKETGLTPEIRAMLAELIAEINRRHIVLGAFKVPNIVMEDDGKRPRRLVLVDGFGIDTLIPIYSAFKFANTQRNLKKYRKLIRRAEAIFSAAIPAATPARL